MESGGTSATPTKPRIPLRYIRATSLTHGSTCSPRTDLECASMSVKNKYGGDMELRRVGESDLRVSALGLGTLTFGQQNSEADAHAQLDLAVSRGVNFIDSAEMYPVPPRAETQGRTESYIGSPLEHKQREKKTAANTHTERA